MNITHGGMILVDAKTKQPIEKGAKRKDFRGDELIVVGGTPPHKPGSTGRVSVDGGQGEEEYYPGVVDAVWVKA